MSLLTYAEAELNRIQKDEDGMQSLINKDILDIIKIFSEQGHSGSSAHYAISVLERLLRFKPLSPLTGEDDEWNDTGHGSFQNKRCYSVFKNKDGRCYDIDATAVSDNGGITWYRSKRFEKEVTFPYAVPLHPEKIYIEYTEDVPPGFTSDKYEIITNNPDRINALYQRMRKEFNND